MYDSSSTSVQKGQIPSTCYSLKKGCCHTLINLPPHTHTHITSLPLCPGGYTPRSSLPSFIRRTLIFSLMSVSACRSGQKQSSAGAITTSRGIPQNTLCPTHTHADNNILVLLPSRTERSIPPLRCTKLSNRQIEVFAVQSWLRWAHNLSVKIPSRRNSCCCPSPVRLSQLFKCPGPSTTKTCPKGLWTRSSGSLLPKSHATTTKIPKMLLRQYLVILWFGEEWSPQREQEKKQKWAACNDSM